MPEKDKELAINKGIELMLRRKDTNEKPLKGFTITKTFSLLKRIFYFNIDLKWEKQ